MKVAAATLTIMLGLAPISAPAYPVDCAILLCLAGGWPANPPCTAARAEFVRRVTPWPVEPPLQPWRCPMGAGPAGAVPRAHSGASLIRDLLGAIRVHHVDYRQSWADGSEACQVVDRSRLGRYGPGGTFGWTPASARGAPAASRFAPPRCDGGFGSDYRYRSVVVEWRDVAGGPGWQEVRY